MCKGSKDTIQGIQINNKVSLKNSGIQRFQRKYAKYLKKEYEESN